MFSFTELHIKVSELLNNIKEQKLDDISEYIKVLEQIDKILISLDILAQQDQKH